MIYDSFKTLKFPYDNLYNIIRKSDGRELGRGLNYNRTMDLIKDMKELVEIYFY